jgi:hypothetical protein
MECLDDSVKIREDEVLVSEVCRWEARDVIGHVRYHRVGGEVGGLSPLAQKTSSST